MRIKKNILMSIGVSLFTLLFSMPSYGLVVITLGKGTNQGDLNRNVYISDYVPSTEESTITASCSGSGSTKCPTTAELRSLCPNAIVIPWIPNEGAMGLDNTISYIMLQFNSGTNTGTIFRTYVHSETSESIVFKFTWQVDSVNSDLVNITVQEMI